jgi:hypothetical protein
MKPEFALVGLIAAGAGMFGSLAASIWTAIHRRHRLTSDDGTIRVHVGGRIVDIDPSKIEREDPKKLERTLQQLRAEKSKELLT